MRHQIFSYETSEIKVIAVNTQQLKQRHGGRKSDTNWKDWLSERLFHEYQKVQPFILSHYPGIQARLSSEGTVHLHRSQFTTRRPMLKVQPSLH